MAKTTAKKAKKKTTRTATRKAVKRSVPAKAKAAANGQAGKTGDGGESLEKVRDILFGSQQRDNEERFGLLEDQIAADLQALRDDTRKRLDSLEE
ncbi:MAG: hypothetical protein AAGK78_04430, partial [Planctomycetota bacterium]